MAQVMANKDYPTLSSAELRKAFLAYFTEKGCKVFPSSSLVPEDASLLLTNAGMNQFKSYFLGTKTLKEAIGATSCQKCLRTNDIDVIGLDGRHLSFFEMLGNFSFGGYSKRQACTWALDFVLNVLSLPQERLYFTVYKDDDECARIWEDLGIAPSHITRLGMEDNFWAAGPTGPCGPCSEIYFDQGEDVGCKRPDCAPGCDCDRFLEFWNLVFTQYNRTENGELLDLPHQNVDTGMGLERLSAIMQHKSSNYDSDILHALIVLGEKLSKKTYGQDEDSDMSLRIIADHSRAVTFMIADGILPSNEGRGYVLRRLLRRAVFHGRLLGIKGNFLTRFVAEIKRLMGQTYPELIENEALINKTVLAEEERFQAVIETGQDFLAQKLEGLKAQKATMVSGQDAFTLHDTYGFPFELTQEIAEKEGFSVDEEAFKTEMAAQKERARKKRATEEDAWKNVDIWTELSEEVAPTIFVGYDSLEVPDARVVLLVDALGNPCERVFAEASVDADAKEAASARAKTANVQSGADARTGKSSHADAHTDAGTSERGKLVYAVFDKTPFYAERGGQVADTGVVTACDAGATADAASLLADVEDVKDASGLYVHTLRLKQGTLALGDTVCARVDAMRRSLIQRNHTATHLLDAALMKTLGAHVHQAGSFVGADRLRFDFTHFEALTPAQLQEVERFVNEAIAQALPVETKEMSLAEAKKTGAQAQFSEKYSERVRVVSVGCDQDVVSRELCGGTHAKNTAELGLFKIINQSSVGAAARRIEALTSLPALRWINEHLFVLQAAAASLKVSPLALAGTVDDMQKRAKELKQKLASALSGQGNEAVVKALGAAVQTPHYKMVIARLDGREPQELRQAWDFIKQQAKEPIAAFFVSATPEKKTALLAAGTDEAVQRGFNAADLVKRIAQEYGGRGGGRPQLAQGGIEKAEDAENALSFLRKLVTQEQ